MLQPGGAVPSHPSQYRCSPTSHSGGERGEVGLLAVREARDRRIAARVAPRALAPDGERSVRARERAPDDVGGQRRHGVRLRAVGPASARRTTGREGLRRATSTNPAAWNIEAVPNQRLSSRSFASGVDRIRLEQAARPARGRTSPRRRAAPSPRPGRGTRRARRSRSPTTPVARRPASSPATARASRRLRGARATPIPPVARRDSRGAPAADPPRRAHAGRGGCPRRATLPEEGSMRRCAGNTCTSSRGRPSSPGRGTPSSRSSQRSGVSGRMSSFIAGRRERSRSGRSTAGPNADDDLEALVPRVEVGPG